MYILFDIGGTKISAAASPDGKKITKIETIRTPPNFEKGVAGIHTLALKLAQGSPSTSLRENLLTALRVKAVVLGIAGTFTRDKTKLFNSPNLRGWAGKPLKASLKKFFNCPVLIENDAALAGLGEAVYGAGQGKRIVAYITVSTGVGGARIVDGKIDERSVGFEPGHQIIDIVNKKSLENLVSGSAIIKKYHKEPYTITDKKFWDNEARLLAYGLRNITMLWSPEVIVLGGSMMKKIGIPLSRLKFHFKRSSNIFPTLPLLKKTELGDQAGLWGALVFLRENKLKVQCG